jgi:hypothetical protein
MFSTSTIRIQQFATGGEALIFFLQINIKALLAPCRPISDAKIEQKWQKNTTKHGSW